MLVPAYSLVLATATSTATPPCEATTQRDDYHLSDVCDEIVHGEEAYSATFRASLVPRPASQQVLIYRQDGSWRLRAAGYRWNGGLVMTRRNDVEISSEDAERIRQSVTADHLARLARLPFYGSDDVICTDGATTELAASWGEERHSARQHSCAGDTELTTTATLFREIAIKYDPNLEGFLTGFTMRD